MLTAQIIRNENPAVRATAPSAVNALRPHLAGGLGGLLSPPPPPPAKTDVLWGVAQEPEPPDDCAGSGTGR